MGNRIAGYIEMVRMRIAEIGRPLNGGTWADADAALDLSSLDRAGYKVAISNAVIRRHLTADEAQTALDAIGPSGTSRNGGWPMGVDYATKVAVTKLVGELLGVPA